MRILIACFFIAFQLYVQAQVPVNPNLTDSNGLRQGKWTILYDKDWNVIDNKNQVVYYRLIEYKDDKPIGRVIDYYGNGKTQWEGILLQDRPNEVMDGEVKWYREDGSTEMVSEFEAGKQISITNYNPDGSLNQNSW